MLKRFSKYVFQSVAGMIGISVYVLADTFFISVYAGADGLAVLNLILPVYGVIYAIGSMIGIGSATRYGINRAKCGLLLPTVCWMEHIVQHSFCFAGSFCSGKGTGTSGSRCRSGSTGKNLYQNHSYGCTLFYV